MDKLFQVVESVFSLRHRCFCHFPCNYRTFSTSKLPRRVGAKHLTSIKPLRLNNSLNVIHVHKFSTSWEILSASKEPSTCNGRCFGLEKPPESSVLTDDKIFKIETKVECEGTELNESCKQTGESQQDLKVEETDMAKELVEICENYSKAHGSYVAWETYVNLNPPKAWGKPAPEGDKYIEDYYNSLQYTLYETGHPETIDRTPRPRKQNNNECVNVVYLSSPVECIGVLLEGGKQLPDGFHLVLSPSWLSKLTSEEDPSFQTLLLHKSISFHSNGGSFIDEFDPPRRVTYFVNFFTEHVTSGQRNDGIELEKNIDCPMSSSVKLCELVDDKVWTRDVMAEVGMEIPETLAIRRIPTRKLSSGENKIKTFEFECFCTLDMDIVAKEIATFSKGFRSSGIQKIVVKPSGPKYLGSVGISLHSSMHVSSIVKSVEELLMEIDEGCAVLVEEFIEHLLPQDTGGEQTVQWSVDPTLGFRVRSTVCRDHDDTPVTTLINCAIANKCTPINGDNSVCQSLDSTLLAYNISDKDARQQLEHDIRIQSADVMRSIMEKEGVLNVDERGSLRGQTDVIGIDMIVTNKCGKLIPVGIEVNSHDCTINTQLYDFMMSLGENLLVNSVVKKNVVDEPNDYIDSTGLSKGLERGQTLQICKEKNLMDRDKFNIQMSRYNCGGCAGKSVRPLVRNMIARSQRYVIRGKQIVVIGGGGFSKRNIWPDAAAYGVQIILVEADPNHLARDHVQHFIHYDFEDHQKDFAHACNIVNLFHTRGIHVDGCLTFWEDCGPLAALINELLETRGSSYKAALAAKKKSITQNVLRKRNADIPHWPRTHLYHSKSVHLKREGDSALVPKHVNFPVILKLEHGSSAVGVTVVRTEDELKNKHREVTQTLRTETDYPGIGLGYDNTMVAMEFQEGSEHDVDVIMYDRKLIGAFISDNGPTRVPFFTETTASIPSSLPPDKQAQLIAAAYQCCTEIGLKDGTFNVELMMTKTGPKLIEINARMGGFYLRDWIKNVYGVDLMLYSLMIASSVKPYVPKHPPDSHLVGVMLLPSLHSHVFRENHIRNKLKKLIDNGEILFVQLGEEGEQTNGDLEEPVANVAVSARTTKGGSHKLIHICKDLGIDNAKYQVEQFLKYF